MYVYGWRWDCQFCRSQGAGRRRTIPWRNRRSAARDHLAKARTACIASARYLSELSMTEDDLPEEEYLILAEMGIDTGYQSVEFASVPVFVDGAQ